MKIRRKSLIVKRSILIAGRRTSVSVEDAFWNRLKEIAADRNMTLSDLVTTINSKRTHNNLSSAIRLFVLEILGARRLKKISGGFAHFLQ
jgi:predicted DNA-binding ribbon-helix-helix protein